MRGRDLKIRCHPIATPPTRLIYKVIALAHAHDHVVLCDLKSRKRLAYVVLGIGAAKGFEA